MKRVFLLAIFISVLGFAHAAAARSRQVAVATSALLVSPWDPVPAGLTGDPYNCAASPLVAPDITVTSGLGNSNLSPAVRQAVYPESDAALHDLSALTVAAADAFRRTGSQAAARCTVALLAQAAADHAMAGYMASSDAAQEQNITLRSIAIAYLKVRNSGVASQEEQALISAWFEDIARQERARIETAPCAQHICVAHGHHGIGVVMAVAAVAIASNDRALFAWSLGQYRAAIDQIDNRGMLHYDTHGQYALKFNLESAACLAQIAEFGEINGIPLYDYDHGRIALLIHTVSRGLIDSSPYSGATGIRQRIPSTIEPWEISWASVYNLRYPDPVLTGLLEQAGHAGADMWGGEPLASAMP